MSQAWLFIIVYAAIYLPLIGYVYGRQQRWLGAAGWALLMAGVLLATSGGGDLFPWAGLLWATVAAFGALLIVMDVLEVRKRRL